MLGAHTDLTELKRTEEELYRRTLELEDSNRRLVELARVRDRLAAESGYLREDLNREHGFDEIVGRSDVMVVTLRPHPGSTDVNGVGI